MSPRPAHDTAALGVEPLTEFSHHTDVFVLEPTSVDRTRIVSWQLTTGQPDGDAGDNDDSRHAVRRDVDFVAQGAVEDFAMAGAVQRGLASGANEVLTFGRFEGALTHLHRQLHELIDTATSALTPTRRAP